MWGDDRQLERIADACGGVVGADAIEDDELAHVVAQLAAESDQRRAGLRKA
jgi:hypothetical protein